MSTIDPHQLKLIFTDAITHVDGIKRWKDEGDVVSFTNPIERFDNHKLVNGVIYEVLGMLKPASCYDLSEI